MPLDALHRCDVIHSTFSDLTFLTGSQSGLEGIPENLTINVIFTVIMVIIFIILTKMAWKYRRTRKSKYCQKGGLLMLFYGDALSEYIYKDERDVSVFQSSLFQEESILWLISLFINRNRLLKRCGRDTVQYLVFQRYMILYFCLLSMITMTYIFPINISGSNEPLRKKFGRTTLSNLPPDSGLLYIHVIVSFIMTLLLICFMRIYSSTLLHHENKEMKRAPTVMISEIPKEFRTEDKLSHYILTRYPQNEIIEIKFAYNINKLEELIYQRNITSEALNYCKVYEDTHGKPFIMSPMFCGCFCIYCCCQRTQVNAHDFYIEQDSLLKKEISKEKDFILKNPLGIAFVTFRTSYMANHIVRKELKLRKGYFFKKKDTFHYGHASSPEDILWTNLKTTTQVKMTKYIVLNTLNLLVTIFATTPAFFISITSMVKDIQVLMNENSWLLRFLPAFFFLIFSLLLPEFIIYTNRFVGQTTKSSRNGQLMRRVYIFLVLMVIIVPSIEGPSVYVVIETSFKKRELRWDCLFLPDNGAFFVNYLINSAFIGTVINLLRLPELFLYVVYMCFSRSLAESSIARFDVLWEIQLGIYYSSFMLVVTLVIIYAVPCPFIAPFGLMYAILKHLVDCYRIYFYYCPVKTSTKIHSTAISFALVAVFLKEWILTCFLYIRIGFNETTILSTIFVMITGFLCLSQDFPINIKGLDCLAFPHHQAKYKPTSEYQKDFTKDSYLPKSLIEADLISKETNEVNKSPVPKIYFQEPEDVAPYGTSAYQRTFIETKLIKGSRSLEDERSFSEQRDHQRKKSFGSISYETTFTKQD